MKLPDCEECRASIVELMEAYRAIAQEMAGTRIGTDQEFAQSWHRARMLRTEEDVVLAEQLFPSVKFNSSPKVGLALNRMLVHEVRTGHKARCWLRPSAGS